MPLTSASTEDEERAFNFLKEISKHTSNHHAENVLLNSFIRLQVRDEWDQNLGTKKRERYQQTWLTSKTNLHHHGCIVHIHQKESHSMAGTS